VTDISKKIGRMKNKKISSYRICLLFAVSPTRRPTPKKKNCTTQVKCT
jgi:hypothetical protein